MEGVRHDDPFLWDVEAVVESLCSLSRPCTRDQVALADRIKEEGVDGHTLLTFEFVCSRIELFDCLGIKLGAHKASLGRAIIGLRAKSPAFRRWKLDLTREQPEDVPASPEPSLPSLPVVSQPAQNPHGEASDASAEQPMGGQEPDLAKRKLQQLEDQTRDEPVSEGPPALEPLDESTTQPRHDSSHADTGHERSTKRKRLVPTHLTEKPVNLSPLPLATEADVVMSQPAVEEDQYGFAWEQAAPHAYLGKGVMPMHAIKSPTHGLTTQVLEDRDTFATSFPVRLPTGLRLMANRVMKRHLIGRGRKEALWRQGLVAMESPESWDVDDDIIELSDLPDSFDEQTLREIEAEKAEALQPHNLVEPERVHALLQEAVDGFKEHWEHTKLLKHQRKAHKIWTDARRRGTKTRQVLQARQLAKAIDKRLHTLWADIVEEKWAKEDEVRLQARSLEQSVEDKQYNVWLAATLISSIEPPKPDSLPRPKRPATRRPQSPNGSEVLTSSDEEDFIVPDHEPEEAMDIEMDIDKAAPVRVKNEPVLHGLTPMKAESPMLIDLTQIETPQSLRRARRDTSIIDLTLTPASPRRLFVELSSQGDVGNTHASEKSPPSDETFESVEQIGTQLPKHWVERKDRSNLLICLLWRLPAARRIRIFQAARDNPSDELFALSIGKHLSEPLQDLGQLDEGGIEAVPFDMTSLFLSYIRVKICRPIRIIRLSDGWKGKIIKGKEDTWRKFHDFLKHIESAFPQNSQIFRTDAFDVEPDPLDEAEDDARPDSQGTPSRSRKNAPKEIVRNKDAVDLRERERRRIEEQESRRLKLRASLNTSGMMSRDKSRLIINETKHEDQPFIYVNEEAGKRIKDHQVDGVRFLWNQIVLDADVRQGCLLAHTMGLGKTMQVITFLSAIQESVKSADPAVTAQIPEDLRESKTLVLCPPGLVDNWMDEFLLWAPRGLFGPIRKIESALSQEERSQAVRNWAQEGGVLITGYKMLQKVVAEDEKIEEKLITGPNIVVADEAHVLKNPDTKVHSVCSRFKTNCRIALTGSPLANNVQEYYCMINWVAANYLGPLGEFKEIYEQPIHQGLWGDSLGWEKRKALKMLQVLKETVAPKVHRRTIKSLKNDLPPKHEFVIYMPPTALQRKLYELYVSGVGGGKSKHKKLPQAHIFRIVGDLGALCNHPRCFHQKMLDARVREDGKPGLVPESVITLALKETNSALDLNNPGLSLKTELLSLILDEAREARDKVLVFSQSLPTLDYLMNLLQMQKRRICRLDGETAINKRQDMTKRFNVGDQEAYLISTNAGGVGLNIQGANRVVIFDFKWNPVQEQQAIGRAYRIGQEKPVFVYRFIMAGTFEEDLQNKAIFKTQLASRVVDKKNPVSWSKRQGTYLHPIKPVPAKSLDHFIGKDRVLDKLISYKSNGEAIRSIVSTDTFEEEDPDVDLTAEERRDAEDMVKLNRLRMTDPEEYERQRGEEHRRLLMERVNLTVQHDLNAGLQVETISGVPTTTQALAPLPLRAAIDGPGGLPASHSTRGTHQSGFTADQQQHFTSGQQQHFTAGQQQQIAAGPANAQSNSFHTSSSSTVAPLPMAGANTYFAKPPPPGSVTSTSGAPPVRTVQSTPVPMAGANTYFGNEPPPRGVASTLGAPPVQTVQSAPVLIAPSAGLFSSPQGSQARDSFEQKLRRRLNVVPAFASSTATTPREYVARDVTLAIDKIRKEHAFGFLPDNQHWRLLEEHLDHDRFLPAVIFGHITTSFLALTNSKELESRVSVLNSISEQEFQEKVMESKGNTDPKNLLNLRRSSSQPGVVTQSPRAREDIQVMREAAYKRRQRPGLHPRR